MASTSKTSIVIGGSTAELEAAVDRGLGKLRGMATSVIGMFASISAVKWGIDLVAKAEDAQLSMKAVLGTADLAKSALSGMREAFGDEAKNFHDGFKKLALAGVEVTSIPPMLNAIGEAASALNPHDLAGGINAITDQLVTMMETASVTEKQLKSLGGMGINANEMLRSANNFGSIDELKEALNKGAISSATAVRQLLVGMDKKFKGAFEERQTTHIRELIEDISDQSAQAMKGLATGVIESSGLKEWLRTTAVEMGGLEVIGKRVGAGLGDTFRIVSNTFEGIYTVAKTLTDILVEAFGGAPKTGISDFLKETATFKLDLVAMRSGALDFCEAAAMGFAIVSDKISQYLVEPLKAFVGMMLGAVSTILKAFSELISMGNDLASGKFFDDFKTGLGVIGDKLGITDGAARAGFDASVENAKLRGPQPVNTIQKAIDDAATSLDGLGKNLFDHAVVGFNAGDVMSGAMADTFTQIRTKFDATGDGGPKTISAGLGLIPGVSAINALGKDAYAKNVADIVLPSTAEAVKSAMATYAPNSAFMAGSVESQRAVQENRLGGSDHNAIAKQQLAEQRKIARLQEDVKDILDKRRLEVAIGAI